MPPRKDDHRVQPNLLESSTEKQGEIHAGSQTGVGDLAGTAYLLASLLKARGRQRIIELHSRHGTPDR
ncbi:hypothetical protein D3C77_796820 [compost metagenome]